MDKGVQMQALAQRLRACAAAQDWQGLRQADAELAPLLAQWKAGPPGAGEAAALEALRDAHAQARRACAAAVAAAQVRLQTLCDSREGWLSYALNEDAMETQE